MEREKQMAQMVSYWNLPAFLRQRSLSWESWPGCLSTHVAGDAFTPDRWSRCFLEWMSQQSKLKSGTCITKNKKKRANKQTKQNKKTTLSVRVYFIDILPETSTVIFLLGKHCAYVLSRFSNIGLFETLWTVAHQGPLSIGFSRQE